MTLDEVVQATQGRIVSQKSTLFFGVGTDSRKNLNGSIFVALKGEAFNGHHFLSKAVQSGACALIIHEEVEPTLYPVTVVQVQDTLKALQNLAHYWRLKHSAKVLAITGSNGKTTTKEFAMALISPSFVTHVNQGSFNNHWGVPLTLLGIHPEHKVVIVEMGMNHVGEIRELCKITVPEVVVVTTVGRGHLEGLRNIESIAQAKEEIYLYSSEEATGIYNLDNELTYKMWKRSNKKNILTFSSQLLKNPHLDVSFEAQTIDESHIRIEGSIRAVRGSAILPIFGEHNRVNVMAAACLALSVGVTPKEIWERLPFCKMNWGRNQWVTHPSGLKILFDGYNANPDSMKALIEGFIKIPCQGKRGLILGEMLELGSQASHLHEELGEVVAQGGYDFVWFYGPHAKDFEKGLFDHRPTHCWVTEGFDDFIAQKIFSLLQKNDFVALKGSRGMKLERVLTSWGISSDKNT